MMLYAIRLFCFTVVGFVLGVSGLTILTWQFWVIAVALLGMLATVGKA